MKVFTLLFLFPLASMAASFTDVEAEHHVGDLGDVSCDVASVHVSRKATFINCGAPYPHETFSGVIFSSNAAAFPNVQALQGKHVTLHGVVQSYKGKPEIVLRNAEQITQ